MRWEEQVYVDSSFAPYKPERSLLWALSQFDNGRMRLRWSARFQEWCLERHVSCGIDYIKTLAHWVKRKDRILVENDSWIRARDGYVLIWHEDAVPRLDHWLIRKLRYCDLDRIGGPREADLLLIQQEERRAARIEKRHTAERQDAAGDWWDSETWRQGERISVPAQATGI